MSETVRSITRVQGFNDGEMDFQLLRQLGSATYGGAAIGEILSLVPKISGETADEWVTEFTILANNQQQDAQMRLLNGHLISAREQFLKACNSFRAAEYYTHSNSPTHRELGLKSRDNFLEYLKLSEYGNIVSFIEYNGLQLPYYLITPTKEVITRKTIIIISGFDGTLEESFIQFGLAGLARGYNVVCFAGPGQMDSLRFNQTHFEPDFDKPVSCLIDILSNYPQIDVNQLAVMGISFGGYFATRAACYEPRIKALIANSPIINLKRYVLGFSVQDDNEIRDDEDFSYSDIHLIPDEVMPPSLKELTANLLLRFGNKSMKQTVNYLDEFNITEHIDQINCPTLALIGTGEGEEPFRQYRDFLAKLRCVSSAYQFTLADGADTHCQVANLGFSNCVAYDWLDEQFNQ